MRKHIAGIVFIFILALIVPGTIGCGGGNANTPEETVRAYIQAYESKNTTVMATLQTQEYTESLSGGHTAYWTNRWGETTSSIKDLQMDVMSQDATTAAVMASFYITSIGSAGNTEYQGSWTRGYTLIKIDGKWLISSEVE